MWVVYVTPPSSELAAQVGWPFPLDPFPYRVQYRAVAVAFATEALGMGAKVRVTREGW